MGCVAHIYKNDFNQDEFTTNQNFLIQVAGELNIPIFFTSTNMLPSNRKGHERSIGNIYE